MCEVQEMLDGLYETFSTFKVRQQRGMIQILETVRCCDCGHKKRLENAQKSRGILCGAPCGTTATSSSSSRARRVLIACFVLLVLVCLYFIHVARRYNHVRAYGSNACGSTFFYSYNDCDVLV